MGRDGPEALPLNAQDNSVAAAETKEKFFKFFLTDFIELTMRKVAFQNAEFCANKCDLLSKATLMADLTLKQERDQMACFERCLGKHSDSFEVALDVFGNHLRSAKQQNVITHSHEGE